MNAPNASISQEKEGIPFDTRNILIELEEQVERALREVRIVHDRTLSTRFGSEIRDQACDAVCALLELEKIVARKLREGLSESAKTPNKGAESSRDKHQRPNK